jgi:PTS system nitrogen regulatory IIA component
MNLKRILTEDTIRVGLKGQTKHEIIEELLDILVAAGHVHDRKEALKALLDRESKMSTALQNGLALPHAKTESVDRLVAALATKPEGVDFASIDSLPTTIFVMTLSPLNRAGPHIQFLAEIGRLVGDDATRAKIVVATTADEIARLLDV